MIIRNLIKSNFLLHQQVEEKIQKLWSLLDDVAPKIKQKMIQEQGNKLMSSSYFEEGMRNLKLYYVATLVDPLNKHGISKKVDEFWHTHILFTKDYRTFCNEIFGHYVDHEPLLECDAKQRKEVEEVYVYTLNLYKEIFNEDVISSEWWAKEDYICLHTPIDDPALIKLTEFSLRKGAQVHKAA